MIFPTLGENILSFVAGGILGGKPAPDLAVAVSPTHLYYYTAKDGLVLRPLPTQFMAPCNPVTSVYNEFCLSLLGQNFQSCSYGCANWPNHVVTQSLAVDQVKNSRVLATAGWSTNLMTNDVASEFIFFSRDAGASFTNIFDGSLIAAAQVEYSWMRVRPMGMVFIDGQVLLVATARGVCRCILGAGASCESGWARLGSTQQQFPIVRTTALAWYPKSDVLVVATKGRGTWMMRNASKNVLPPPETITSTTVAPSTTTSHKPSESSTTPAETITSTTVAPSTTTSHKPSESSTTPAPESPNEKENNQHHNTVAIAVGCSVAGLVVVAVVSVLLYRRAQRRRSDEEGGYETLHSVH
jgi:hypothetical protein